MPRHIGYAEADFEEVRDLAGAAIGGDDRVSREDLDEYYRRLHGNRSGAILHVVFQNAEYDFEECERILRTPGKEGLNALRKHLMLNTTCFDLREVKVQGISDSEIKQLVASVDYSEALSLIAGESEVRVACRDARRYGFRAVAAFPQYLGILVNELKGSHVRAQIPVGFPCGGVTTHVKCIEAEEGLRRGANDLDMMMNLSAFKAGNYEKVADDIAAVLAVAEPFHVPFKVIIEVGALTDSEIMTASKLVVESGADFVKTCTGFGPGRATVHAVRLIKEAVGDRIGIKASGGVASLEDGIVLMRAGATIVALRKQLVEQLDALGWQSSRILENEL